MGGSRGGLAGVGLGLDNCVGAASGMAAGADFVLLLVALKNLKNRPLVGTAVATVASSSALEGSA